MIAESQLRKTYRQLRVMAAATLIAFPLAIVLVGLILKQDILPTLSHYYFFEEQPGIVRTLFTSFLVLIGGIMLAYRGFDEKDNWVHNLAGVSAICVAAFPKICGKSDYYCYDGLLSVLHGPFAFLLFCLAAYAVWYTGGPTLKEKLSGAEINTLAKSKKFALATMATGIAVYLVFIFFGRVVPVPDYGILIVELLGFFGFASHWIVITRVISEANARLAATPTRAKSDRAAAEPEQELETVTSSAISQAIP